MNTTIVKSIVLSLAITSSTISAQTQTSPTNLAVIVRHTPSLNAGTIEGSLQQLEAGNVTLNGGFILTGDLLVPGTPTVLLNGKPSFSGTIVGTGSPAPTGNKITLNGNCSLHYLRTRTTPVSLPSVAAPSPPTGTRSVNISKAGQSFGDASTLRNLTLNGNVGMVAVPPGSYGNFTVNGGSGLVLGVAGGVKPATYNFQMLNLNGNSTIKIIGPIILNLANSITINGSVGVAENPSWLQLQLAGGGLTLNGGSALYGMVLAPNGSVIINGNSKLIGSLASDQFTMNGGGLVRWAGPASDPDQPPSAQAQSVTLAENSPAVINLLGSDPQGRGLTYTILTQPAHGTITGIPPTVTYRPATNFFGNDAFTFKVNNGILDSSAAVVSLTVTQINYPPIATAQSLTNHENVAWPITLTGSDPQGYALSYIVLTQPTHGTLSGTAPFLTYQPATNYYGGDSFTFKVNDGITDSSAATVNLFILPVDYPPIVFAGLDQQVILPTNTVHLAGSVSYSPFPGTIKTLVWSQTSGPGAVNFSDPSNAVTSASFSQPGLYRLELTASDSFLTGSNGLWVTVDAPPTVDIVSAMTNTFPGNVILPGVVGDDGLPTNGTLSVWWEKVSGPGEVAFENPTVTNSSAIFSTNGIYKLRLTASDGISTNFEEVTIIENSPPTVNAGGNILATGLNSTLNGMVNDDGLPESLLTLQWSQSSGPGVVSFNDATASSTSITASQSGVYVLALTAFDGATTNFGEVTVTFNLPPLVNAGSNQTANLGALVTLAGTTADDKLPYDTLFSEWSMVSGPGTVTFADVASTNTTATFSTNGVYVLKLSASDGASTNSSEISVTVLAFNHPPNAAGQSLIGGKNAPLEILLSGTDDDGDPIVFSVVTQPIHGTLTGMPPNLVYQPDTDYVGLESFDFVVNDGQTNSAPATILISVNPIVAGPTISVPADQTVRENRILKFDHTRPISIADGNSEVGTLQLSLSVSNGSLKLGYIYGLLFVSGNNNSSNLVVRGSLDDLNNALVSLTYVGAPNFLGTNTLVVSVDDLGFNETGNHLTDSKSIAITVNPSVVLSKSATSGTNFWVGRLESDGTTRMRWILFLAEQDATVTVVAPDKYTNFHDDGTLMTAPGGISVINLQAGVPYMDSLEQLNFYSPVIVSDQITNMDFQISSSSPISLLVDDFSYNDSEAFRPLPTAALGTNYIIAAYSNFQLLQGYIYGSQFAVTAVESNTVVTIVPSTTTSGHAAGQPYTVTLPRGATYTLRHTETATGDLTGSSVTADKPVAVLAGNAFTGIPPNQGYYASGIAEQLMPVEHWDSEYVAAKFSGHAGYAVRILAAYDGTDVQIPGLGETNLNRSQFWELFPTNDIQIIAGQPVAVCQYSLGNPSDPLAGTPNMLWVPGVHQGLIDSQWATPEVIHTLNFGHVFSVTPLYTNLVNLVLPSEAFDDLRINDGPLPPGSSWNLVGNGQYTKVTMPVANDFYQIHCSQPVVTVNYGYLADFPAYGPGSYGLAGPFSFPVFPLNVMVTVATPTNGTQIIAGTETVVAAKITDPQNLVTNVEFFVDGSKFSEGVTTNFVWTPTQAGSFSLQFIANAATGESVTSAPVNVTINYDFVSEGVLIVNPYDGESVYVNGLTIIALDFNDPLGVFDHAEFFANNTSLGQTTNSTFAWVPSSTNDYVLSATIYDLFGTAYNATNTVTVHAVPPPRPTVTITSPAFGNRVRAGVESPVIVSLFDPGQLTTNVQFFVDGIKVSDNTSYFPWTPTQLGGHSLQAIALTSDGDSVASAIINVTVAEMFPPVVKFLTPTNYDMFSSGIIPILNVQASDSDGLITNLAITLDNSVLIETNIATLTMSAAGINPGWHEASAQATDNDGLKTASEIVRFFVERGEIATLPVPGPLAIIATSATGIQLSWKQISGDLSIQDMLVQRWDADNLLWIEITKVAADETNYLDSGLNPETNYRYRIACVDTNGNRSAFSSETNATTRTIIPSYGVIDLSTAVASSLTNLVPGGNTLSNAVLAQFDLRRTVPLGTLHAQSVLGTNAAILRQAAARFSERWPQIQLDFDPILLSPHSILPRVGYLTGPGGSGMTVSAATAQMFDTADPSQPVKSFLQEHHDLFGFGPGEITNAAVQRDYISPATGTRTIVWQQQVGGIPIFNTLFTGHMTASGKLAAVSCDFIPAPVQAADPAVVTAVLNGSSLPLAGSRALQTAINNVGDVFSTTDITSQSAIQGITRSQSYVASKAIKGIAHATLIWFPASRNELKLAWQIIFTSQWRDEMFLTLVSAEDGKILYRRNLTADSSDASYRVYTDSSPEPMLPGSPVPDNTQSPLVDRSLVTLSALDTNASPNGWINDGDNETSGNNVDARLDRNDDNQPDLPRPAGDPWRVFDFGLNLGSEPSSYGNASVVQLFYWDNWMHDVLYGLGFTEAAGNFQTDNFGRGGLSGDALLADAQNGLTLNDTQHRNNANMSTPPDGYPPQMQVAIFDGASPARDASLDAELVVHEYVHGLTARLIGGGAGIDAQQTASMSEGWSDFFALALLANPLADPDAVYPVGSYVAYHGFGTSFDQNYYYGIRHYPYCTDTNKNPLTFMDIDPAQAGIHAGVPCSPLTGPFNPALANESHSQGEIWCAMLWELRANLIHKLGGDAGNRAALQLVAEGLRFSPPNPNFVQARDAILLADRILFNNANAPEIWSAFAKRGLGYDATAPYSYTSAGVKESFSRAPALVTEQTIMQAADGSPLLRTNGVNILSIVIHNQGVETATHVSASISTTTPGVQIVQSQSAYGDLAPGQSGDNLVTLQISTLPGFVEGTPIDLNVTINSDQQSITGNQRIFTGNSGQALPSNGNSSSTPTSGSAISPDLTPWDLGNLEPLWMADDASCLLKAGPGKYVLWRPGADPIPMTNPNFLAHRLTHQGVVVGELTTGYSVDSFGNVLPRTVGAQWIPGQPEPTQLTTGLYTYPKGSAAGQNVGLAYSVDLVLNQLNYLGGVSDYPKLHSLWDMNSSGLSAGAASVYLRPPDANFDGYISTNEVRLIPLERNNFDLNGDLIGLQEDERILSTDNGGVYPSLQIYYNALLTSATRFGPGTTWDWIGPVNFSGGSVFSVGLLINDKGDVAGTGATFTGNPSSDAAHPTRVFRWTANDGEFSLGVPTVQELGLLNGGEHAFPLGMNQTGDIVGYSDLDMSNPGLFHATIWGATSTVAVDLGTLDGDNSQAFALNDNQQIVGASQKYDGSSAATLWQFNHDINNPTGTGYWESNDLNNAVSNPNWQVFNAVGINNDGLILAYAQNVAGENHALLLQAAPLLAVDANRDGNITFDSADATSSDKPYRFWVNNDKDSFDAGIADLADLNPADGSDAESFSITSTRDLEDHTRLWINTAGITTELQNGTLLLMLEWRDTADDPQIQFFPTAEADGGILYLTDPNVAQQQISHYSFHIIEWAHRNVLTKYNPFIFPTSFWSNLSTNQPVAHLLFDAVGRGSGRLVVSIYKNDGVTKLFESPHALHLKLQDVKEMYDRYTVDNNGTVAKTPSLVTSPYAYDNSILAENNYILFVHGWNLAPWERNTFAETAFKRLYWQGYKGRFGAFQWPTRYGFTSWKSARTDPDNYDDSEFNAWSSGTGLLDVLKKLNGTYPNHPYLMAHSMGNVVAGEALKLASVNQVVNTYIAMQGAVPAHCYDQTATFRNVSFALDSDTPDLYANYPTGNGSCYFNGISSAGTCVNFFNENDFALGKNYWQLDQDLKPDIAYSFDGNDFYLGNYNLNYLTKSYILYLPKDRYLTFAYCDEARCYALGAQVDVGGVFKVGAIYHQIDLSQPPYNFGNQHKDHSGEFNSDNMDRWQFWNQVLVQMKLR